MQSTISQKLSIFSRVLDSDIALDVTLTGFLLIIFTALFCGLCFSALYTHNRRKDLAADGLALALVIVPAATAVVITMVGRNIATGLGLSGIFVLVRFRSGPIHTKDLAYLFVSICCGVLSGCGYVAYSLLFAVIMLLVLFILEGANWGNTHSASMILKIWVPENLDFQGAFDPVLKKFTESYKLLMVRTTDFGSMCELRYRIVPKDKMDQKKFLDLIRSRNGNMNVVLIVAPSIVERGSKQVI